MFFKNIILINGAMYLDNQLNMTKICDNLVVDKFINCYPEEDIINKLLKDYVVPFRKQLTINELGTNNINLTDYDFGKRYDLSIIPKIIFSNYNDL